MHMYCCTAVPPVPQEYCDGGTLRAAIDDGKLHDISTGTPRPVMRHILQLATDIAAGT